ncbi:hypothetical protein A7982_13284 [Minicystis rosea]|nr:hypothetical protein A7982_13284 [Minicystis rosea]
MREESMMAKTIEEIRAALVRSNVGFGRPYPQATRQAVIELVAQRRREGVGLSRVAKELGVSATTLRKWGQKDRAASARRAQAKFREPVKFTGSGCGLHRLRPRFSPVKFTEFQRLLVIINNMPPANITLRVGKPWGIVRGRGDCWKNEGDTTDCVVEDDFALYPMDTFPKDYYARFQLKDGRTFDVGPIRIDLLAP